MLKRKLSALDFHSADNIDINNEQQFRNLVLWIEDQKIRQYKIEDREGLRNIDSEGWQTAFHQYLQDVGYSQKNMDRFALVDWLLGCAIRAEYGDDLQKYKNVRPSNKETSSKAQSTNPLDNLEFDSPDFKAGVTSLATLLQIPPHADNHVVLKAICLLVKEKLANPVVEKVQKEGVKPSKTLQLDEVNLGFETSDYITTEAAKILRLLHIKDLRSLQNSVNEAIIAVQALTANPKTDTKLGKVGKG